MLLDDPVPPAAVMRVAGAGLAGDPAEQIDLEALRHIGNRTAAAEPWPAYLNSGSMNSGMTFMPRALALGTTSSRMSWPAHLGIGRGEALDEGVGIIFRPAT